jgi:hypothetical protein
MRGSLPVLPASEGVLEHDQGPARIHPWIDANGQRERISYELSSKNRLVVAHGSVVRV